MRLADADWSDTNDLFRYRPSDVASFAVSDVATFRHLAYLHRESAAAAQASVGAVTKLNQTDALQDNPSMVALGSGRFVALWTANGTDGSSAAVMGRIVGADGSYFGDEFVVNQTTAGFQGFPTIAALADGGFAATWQFSDATSNGNLATRVFNYDGTARTGELAFDLAAGGTYIDFPQSASSSAAGTAYAIIDTQNLNGEPGLYLSYHDANGARVGAAVKISATSSASWDVADLGNGREVVVWRDQNGGLMKGQVFAGANPVSGVFTIDAALTSLSPSVAASGDGGFAVTYSYAGYSWVKPYDNAGVALQAAFVTPTTVATSYERPLIVTLADGTHAVAWSANTGADRDIYLRLYSADWLPTGRDMLLTEDANSSNYLTAIDLLPDGQIVIAYAATVDGIRANLSRTVDLRTAAIDFTGTAMDDVAVGTAWNDVLDGGAGADRLVGGAGDDRYIVDDAQDVIVELAGGGTDSVRASVSYILPANVEALVLVGAATSGTGNAGANTITGNARVNTLDGGGGADTLAGGLGNDVYYVDNVGDVVVERVGEGKDVVYTTVSYTLGAGQEIETLAVSPGASGSLTLTGNAFVNLIDGGGGDDRLDGGGGKDTLRGGLGNDTYVVGEAGVKIVEAPGAGVDTVIASIDYKLGANIENLTLAGSALRGTGNNLANAITGTIANDILRGAAGDDLLAGGDGDDKLFGDDGADTLLGGAGDDTLNGGAGGDVLTGGSGRDIMTGGAGADRFIFTAIGDFSGAATNFADRITDFSHAQRDRIVLDAIDAKSGGTANDAFNFIGAAAFSGAQGQLRYEATATGVTVYGDINGDRVADFAIRVDGVTDLVAGDFVL